MAIFRKIHVQFWSDVFIQSLTPEQKFFFLYLLTNERTKQCGVYEISTRQISYDTGYNVETINKLIDFFESTGKILFSRESNEIAIKNWDKYNGSRSPDVKNLVNKEVKSIKNKKLIEWVQSGNTVVGLSKSSLRGEPEEEPEREEEKEPEEKSGKKKLEMVVLEMIQIFKKKFPNYPVKKDFDYPACLQIAYRIAEMKKWKQSEIVDIKTRECLLSWIKIVDFMSDDEWLKTRSIPDMNTDKEWSRLIQKMTNNGKSTTKGVGKTIEFDQP